MVRYFMRLLGFKIHKGWEPTHRSGYDIQCIGCGERRSTYTLMVKGGWPDWEETTQSGDGSCGDIPEKPVRWSP